MSETTEESPDKFFVIGDKSDTDKRFYINGSSGHVGINKIPTTDDTLCVNGNVKTDNLTVNTSATIGNIYANENIYANGRMYIYDSYLTLDNSVTGATNGIHIKMKHKDATHDARALVVHQDTADILQINYGYDFDTVRINNTVFINGNVGIGTTDPAYELDVSGNINIRAPVITGTQGNDQDLGSITFRNNYRIGGGHGTSAAIKCTTKNNSYDDNGSLAFCTGNGASDATVKMIVDDAGNVGIGLTDPQYKLDVVGDINFTGDITKNGSGGLIPSGGIIMWSGAVSNIPNGWVICNGVHPTPDLRGKFILGGGGEYNVGNTGGSNSISLSGDNLPSHNHTVTIYHSGEHSHTQHTRNDDFNGEGGDRGPSWGGYDAPDYKGITHTWNNIDSAGRHNHTGLIGHTGGSKSFDNRPAYYALAYIMKT